MIVFFCFVFIFGLVLGSFVNALEYRIEQKMSIGGRSMCPLCKHQLAWYDLVPVFSWVWLRGKCRYCGKKISAQYPIVEILSGLSLLALVNTYILHIFSGFSFLALVASPINFLAFLGLFLLICVLSTILVLVALHDYKTGFVLSYYTYFAMAAVAIMLAFNTQGFVGWPVLLLHIYSALGAAAPFATLWAVSRGKWMGAGDIEIAFLAGLILGWPATAVGMYFAFIVGSIVGLALVGAKKSNLKSAISFGPFLIAGIYFALLSTQQIVDAYVRIFLG